VSKIYHFWQELKRRNVVRRNTVYAATAFVILEVASIVQDPLNLPEWTLTLVIVLLSFGFIISVILTWIYETNPEGELEKTKPIYHVKNEGKSVTSSYWKIASYISFVVIVGLIVFNIVSNNIRTKEISILEKSIAVLPFTDISEKQDQAYFTDGMMIEILDHLFKMKDLRIIPLNSTLKYKDATESLKEMASELGVAHLIQGSVRKADNKVKISVALIDGNTEKYIWNHTYEADITEVSRIFSVQSDVASQIARAMSVQITPEVNIRMNSFPTQSRDAYDLYLKGRDTWGEKSIAYLNEALAIDSTFADAYVMLSMKTMANVGFSDQPDLWKTKKEYLYKAIALDPQNSRAYSELAVVNGLWDWDNTAGRQNLQKAISLNPADLENYEDLFFFYLRNFDCDSMRTTLETMKLLKPGDYYFHEVTIKLCAGDEEGMRTMNPPADFMRNAYNRIANELSRMLILKNYEEVLNLLDTTYLLNEEHILAFKASTLGHMGKAGEAQAEIDKLEKLATTRYISPAILAMAYMANDEENKAYVYLEKGISEHDQIVHFIQYYPPFYSKREDPRYQKLMKGRWVN